MLLFVDIEPSCAFGDEKRHISVSEWMARNGSTNWREKPEYLP